MKTELATGGRGWEKSLEEISPHIHSLYTGCQGDLAVWSGLQYYIKDHKHQIKNIIKL